jgi:protein-tyrosine phosphatase
MPSRTVLFLCTGNYYRSRFAEILFNALAEQASLPWRADSRALALELGWGNVGPMSPSAVQRLAALRVHSDARLRWPLPVDEKELAEADLVVAVKEAEHRPLLKKKHPTWVDRVEYWHIHDLDFAPAEVALAELEAEVRGLVERLASEVLR